MTRPRLTILDVGKGLCAVLRDARGALLFDVAPGPVPRNFLRRNAIRELDAVFISHHHVDHCGGMSGFLGDDFHVRTVFLNEPRGTQTKAFDRTLLALRIAKRESLHSPDPRVLRFETDVDASWVMDRGEIQITIVGPDSLDCRSQTELTDQRRVHTDHSLCGVARIDHAGRQRVLLTGDLNDRGFAALRLADELALKADVLVYPHHGGASDVRDELAFAEELGTLVQPRLVIFSLAREGGERPHPPVIEGLRRAVPDAHVVCTQLSRRCDRRAQLPVRDAPALPLAADMTESSKHCCGGSVEILLDEDSPVFVGAPTHRLFIESMVQSPQCRPRVSTSNAA